MGPIPFGTSVLAVLAVSRVPRVLGSALSRGALAEGAEALSEANSGGLSFMRPETDFENKLALKC